MTKKHVERRAHRRFPVVDGLVEPITLQTEGGPKSSEPQPAILVNLSAGGMSLVTFVEPPRTKRLEMVLSLPGLQGDAIEGKVVRVLEKGQTYSVGIAFTRISKRQQERICRMADDNGDCETRISLGLPEACVQTCAFHGLCLKPQKGPYWK